MSRLSLPRLPLGFASVGRRLGAALRALPDLLAAAWRLLAGRWAATAAAGLLAALLASALVAPTVYLVPGSALGLAPAGWPGPAARLAALSLLAAQWWGFAVVALCLLVAAVQGAKRFDGVAAAPAATGSGERVLLYSDRPAVAVSRSIRALAALCGYRWRPCESGVVLDRAGTRRTCVGVAALALALAAALLLIWPRVSAVEAVALAQGDAVSLALTPGSVLVSYSAAAPRARFVLRTASGDVAAAAGLGGTWAAEDVTIVRHGGGPALLVRPGDSPLSGNADDPNAVAIGFAADDSQLVTVPGIGKTIRVSLVRGQVLAYDVQQVDTGGAPVDTAYRLTTPAVLTLSGVTLAFRPTSYDALTLWRAPLALPLVLALLLAALAEALRVAYRGPALLLAVRASGPVTGVELSASSGRLRLWWLPLLRLALR